MTLEDLDKLYGKLLVEVPKVRRKLVERSGSKLYDKVLRNIDASTTPDTGNLKLAVTKVIGSEGGYCAIKPNWKRAPHTHLVENGHRLIRGKKGKTQNFIRWVPGVHMYRNAINELADELEADAEKAISEMIGDTFD